MDWVLMLLSGGVVVLGGRHLLARRRAHRAEGDHLVVMRTLADEDVTLLGEELARLDGAVDRLDDEGRGDYQRALDGYETAQRGSAADAVRRRHHERDRRAGRRPLRHRPRPRAARRRTPAGAPGAVLLQPAARSSRSSTCCGPGRAGARGRCRPVRRTRPGSGTRRGPRSAPPPWTCGWCPTGRCAPRPSAMARDLSSGQTRSPAERWSRGRSTRVPRTTGGTVTGVSVTAASVSVTAAPATAAEAEATAASRCSRRGSARR